MKKRVKINPTDFNGFLNRPKKKNVFKRFVAFMKYNLRYNKFFVIMSGTLSVLLVAIVLYNVIFTYARIGFNQNIVNGESVEAKTWYRKLVSNKSSENKNYAVYDDSITWFEGEGTSDNPFIISNPKHFDIIRQYLNQDNLYVDSTDNSIINGIFTPTTYFTYSRRVNRNTYTGTAGVTITNETGRAIKNIYFTARTDQTNVSERDLPYIVEGTTNNFNVKMGDTVLPEIDDENFSGYSYNEDSRTILISMEVNIAAGETVTFSWNNTSTGNSNHYYVEEFKITTQATESEGEKEYYRPDLYKNLDGFKDFYFKITNNLDMSYFADSYVPIGSSVRPFRGNVDGQNNYINHLSIVDSANTSDGDITYYGLFGFTEDATIKNMYFEDLSVKLNGTGNNHNVGGVVGLASSNTKIYNIGIMSGSIEIGDTNGGSGNIGGIVGKLSGTSVVANSYNYADVISGNNNGNVKMAGLVGNRVGSSDMRNSSKVILLVNYGGANISSGDYKFVYNGDKVSSSKSPSYTYYLWTGNSNDTNSGYDETYSIMKSSEELSADGFKAHLNNYRYLVNYYLGFDSKVRDSQSTGYPEIGFWIINNDIKLYPYFTKYTGISDSKYDDWTFDKNVAKTWENGYIIGHFNNSSGTDASVIVYLKITEKNEEKNDYVNHKVVLPFDSKVTHFSYSGKSDDYEYRITAWNLSAVVQKGKKITSSVSGESINYNYALRTGTNGAAKDIGFLYAQGGYYLVPDGVTEIFFEAKWAKVIYVADTYEDYIYNSNYEYQSSASSNFGTRYSSGTDGKTKNTPVHGLKEAYSKGSNAGSGLTYTDLLFVLCGNVHVDAMSSYMGSLTFNNGNYPTSSTWPYSYWNNPTVTITSLDEDGDLEPDYSLYFHNAHDTTWPSIRFDFVNILGYPQSGTVNGKLNEINMDSGTKLEVSETVQTDRIDLRHSKSNSFKLNGGYWNLYNIWSTTAESKAKNYIYFGGNARGAYVNAGVESTAKVGNTSSSVPVFVVTGGRIETLSSTYFNSYVNVKGNVYFYIDGGYINNFYTTYNASINGQAFVYVNNSYINYYYAGGHSENSTVSGGVSNSITNARIGEYYGGPQFGTIKNASRSYLYNSTFDKVFGSGYGGTETTEMNLTYVDSGSYCGSTNYYYDVRSDCSSSDNGTTKYYCLGKVNTSNGSVQTGFYSMIYSKANCVAKAYANYYSALSAASVDTVELNISDSVINGDVYGGGNKGIVTKQAIVNIENSTIKGSVYGGGLSNTNETVDVIEDTTGYTAPKFISFTVDSEATYPSKVTYTWSSDFSKFSSTNYVNKTQKLIYSKNVDVLGNVQGDVYVNIKNSTIKKDIFGGGNASNVDGSVYLNIYGTKTKVSGSIYGGANEAVVKENVDLRLADGNYKNIYGAGNKGEVQGDAVITVQKNIISENIYAGGNEAIANSSTIYFEDGEATNVYGGSNSSGIVSESHIYVGVKNDTEQKFLPDGYTITPLEVDDSSTSDSDEGGETLQEEYPYLPSQDTCLKRNLTYSYTIDKNTGNGANLHFTVTNNTEYSIDSIEATAVVASDVNQITNDWQPFYVTFDADTKILQLTSYDRYNLSTDKVNPKYVVGSGETIDLLSTDGKTSSNPGFGLGKDGVNNTTDFYITYVKITARLLDGNGTIVDYITCLEEGDSDNTSGTSTETVNLSLKEWKVPDVDSTSPHGFVDITNLFGGNNAGGETVNSNIYITGNRAEIKNVYGGGNKVSTGTTNITIENATGITNVYGGGLSGDVSSNTNIDISDSTLLGSVYGGGNLGVVDGDTFVDIKSSSIAGSLFGGGNGIKIPVDENGNKITPIPTSGSVNGATNINLNESTISGSVYGGGNGESAVGKGDSYVVISGSTSLISGSVFGSGNAAASGVKGSTSANTHVYIAGGEIDGSVYGGANTSEVYGNTIIKVGYNDEDVSSDDIVIKGSVYGGSETKAEGNIKFAYDAISVNGTIDISVEPLDDKDISIGGSIFGSGHLSSSSGVSTIVIKNFGERTEPKLISSIQRASKLLIENSSIDLVGDTDSTNNYTTYLYSLSIIDELTLANNSTLYLRENTNRLGGFKSVKVDGSTTTLARVEVSEGGVVSKNVDNRLYMYPNRNYNVAKDEDTSNSEWGYVEGMTYLGLFKRTSSGNLETGYYNDNYSNGQIVSSALSMTFEGGTVAQGLYTVADGYDTNGFYSTMIDDDTNMLSFDYIEPYEMDNHYAWSLGELSTVYPVQLIASKYSTLGTNQVKLTDFYKPNTTFNIIGLSTTDLAEGVTLVNPDDVPRVADTDEDALSTFGLTMKQNVTGWKTDGETTFKTKNGAGVVNGTKKYETANTTTSAIFDLILTHSKNISEDKELGSILIGLRAYVPINEVTTQIRRVYIQVIITAKYYDTDNYEANIRPGKEYDIFTTKQTKITANSSFSAFYSLYMEKKDEDGNQISAFKDGYYRVLTSSFKLPVNTRITMVDRTDSKNPIYYYYVVTEDDYKNVESEVGTLGDGTSTTFYIYKLSKFLRMGSVSSDNLFSDAQANVSNYDSTTGVSAEDYIFVVDYSEATIDSDVLEAELLMELKESDGLTKIDVLPESHKHMSYDIYANKDANIDITITPDRETAYVGTELNLDTNLVLEQAIENGANVYDTNYIQDKMGVKVTLYDSKGNIVTGTNLIGTVFYIDGNAYSANLDGSIRMKVSDFVTNVEKNIRLDLSKSILPTDKYKIVVEAFGSPDGYYLGLTPASSGELDIDIINEQYGLKVSASDEDIVVDHSTGNNLNDTKESKFTIEYNSRFNKPNIRVKLMRRVYDDAYSFDYEDVDLADYVTDTLTSTSNIYEYMVTDDPQDKNELTLHFKDNIKTGSYKLIVEIYNDEDFIGEDQQFIFIK